MGVTLLVNGDAVKIPLAEKSVHRIRQSYNMAV